MNEETASVEDECGGMATVTRSSEPGFTDIHLAANGASELFVLVFGNKGKQLRTCISMAELQLRCVTLEADSMKTRPASGERSAYRVSS